MNWKINTLVRKFAKTEISQYLTIEANSVGTLDEFVNNALREGFIPYGNLVIAKSQYSIIYYQTMVRR
jgi:hypothetical protein